MAVFNYALEPEEGGITASDLGLAPDSKNDETVPAMK